MIRKEAQAVLDYVLMLLIVITALSTMGYYIKNTISGKMREGADSIGQGEVYRPGSAGATNLIYYKVENK